MGSTERVEPAMTRPYSGLYRPIMDAKPTDSVNMFSVLMTVKGQSKSFQAKSASKMAKAAITGLETGIMILKKILHSEAPSMRRVD